MTTSTTLPAGYRRITLRTADQIEAARLALKLLTAPGTRSIQSKVLRDWDEDWYPLIGLDASEQDDDDFDPQSRRAQSRARRQAILAQSAFLQRRRSKGRSRAAECVEQLNRALNLGDIDKAVLQAAILLHRFSELQSLLRRMTRIHGDNSEIAHLLAGALGLPAQGVEQAISRRSRLRRFALLEASSLDGVPGLDSDFAEWIDGGTHAIDRFLDLRVRRSPEPALTIADYAHLSDLARVRTYLDAVVASRRPGVNVLIYGPPGTGKTELVRALARAADIELYEVPVTDSDGDAISGSRRFGAFSFAQRLLDERNRVALLFDEIEDVFGSGDSFIGMFGRSRDSSLAKGWINDQLECNSVPTFWLSNSISAIDRAHIRRFDEVIELRSPPHPIRRRIVSQHFGNGLISPACADRIASIDAASPAQIERTARVVSALTGYEAPQRDKAALQLLENSLRASGLLQRLPQPVLPAHYDPGVLNADIDLDKVVARLQRQPRARLCLYGPPGTGKTAFGHYLAERLERPLLMRRASDLLSKWLGETEQNIAEAFREATNMGAILLIDEADSFLRDRSGAQRSWEITQVNEMLTQMEHFDGMFIASTNLLDQLDAASLRRFDYKLKFGYLQREQRRRLFQRLCDDLAQPDSAEREIASQRIDTLHLLTPGDFANVRRQFHADEERPGALELAKRLEAETAIKPEARRNRPIGFHAH